MLKQQNRCGTQNHSKWRLQFILSSYIEVVGAIFVSPLNLGKKSEIYHRELSRLINSSDIDKVFVKGEKTLFTYKNLKNVKRGNILQCDQDVDFILKNIIANNDYLMVKGSNATGLNAISKTMIKGT